MMNGPVMKIAAEQLASDILKLPNLSERDRLDRACRRILGRPAEPGEIEDWTAFLARYQSLAAQPAGATGAGADARGVAWQGLCRVLMSSNEFIYID